MPSVDLHSPPTMHSSLCQLPGSDSPRPLPRLILKDTELGINMISLALKAIASGRIDIHVIPQAVPASDEYGERPRKGDQAGVDIPQEAADQDALPTLTLDKSCQVPSGNSEQQRTEIRPSRRVLSPGGQSGTSTGREGSSGVYRVARSIDADIMSTTRVEIKPVQRDTPNRGCIPVNVRGQHDDARNVLGPEFDWGLGNQADGHTDESAIITEALRRAGHEGMTLADMRKALKEGIASTQPSARIDLVGLGDVLRSGDVVCVCGATDLR